MSCTERLRHAVSWSIVLYRGFRRYAGLWSREYCPPSRVDRFVDRRAG
jgi:hypothetical protein